MDYPIRFVDQLRPQIRALRKKRGLTQSELGHQLGLGQVRIAEIERSPGTVSFEQMLKLLSLLGTDLVLRDSQAPETMAAPSGEPPAKQAPNNATKRRPHTPTPEGETHPPQRVAPVLAARGRSGAPSKKNLKKGPKLEPDASAMPTTGRSYLIRPKKGSW